MLEPRFVAPRSLSAPFFAAKRARRYVWFGKVEHFTRCVLCHADAPLGFLPFVAEAVGFEQPEAVARGEAGLIALRRVEIAPVNVWIIVCRLELEAQQTGFHLPWDFKDQQGPDRIAHWRRSCGN